MQASRTSNSATSNAPLVSWGWVFPSELNLNPGISQTKRRFDLLQPLRNWLDNLKVQDEQLAHRLCRLIPSQCPFERDVVVFGKTLFHIPPMCKLNPLYEEVVALRFRALCYLADECGVDVTPYC